MYIYKKSRHRQRGHLRVPRLWSPLPFLLLPQAPARRQRQQVRAYITLIGDSATQTIKICVSALGSNHRYICAAPSAGDAASALAHTNVYQLYWFPITAVALGSICWPEVVIWTWFQWFTLWAFRWTDILDSFVPKWPAETTIGAFSNLPINQDSDPMGPLRHCQYPQYMYSTVAIRLERFCSVLHASSSALLLFRSQ